MYKISRNSELIAGQDHHPRSSILVSIERAYATFLLVINSNFGHISYRFRDIDRARKWLVFPIPPSIDAPARGEPVRISGWNLSRKN